MERKATGHYMWVHADTTHGLALPGITAGPDSEPPARTGAAAAAVHLDADAGCLHGHCALGAELGQQPEQVVDVDGAVVCNICSFVGAAEGRKHVQNVLQGECKAQQSTLIGWYNTVEYNSGRNAHVDVDDAVQVDVRAVLVGLARRRADGTAHTRLGQ